MGRRTRRSDRVCRGARGGVAIPASDPARVFGALADPTRRLLVDWLASGESGTATEFAARLPISRQAVTRHLSELAKAGIVIGSRHGKEMRYRLEPDALVGAGGWLDERAAMWDRSLQRLADHVTGHEVDRDEAAR